MIRSRIAPTPSGYLHAGNALNFVTTWLWVRKEKGSLRLRIDDLDAQRAKQEYVDDIFRTLNWLGLDWDEGPQSPDDHTRQYSQLFRRDLYNELVTRLSETGQVFACTCGRKTRRPSIGESQDPCRCKEKKLPLNQPDSALKIATPQNPMFSILDIQSGKTEVNMNDEMRDFVIRRRDGVAAYQVASLSDDIDFKINLIIRGIDLLQSTAAQLFLANQIGNLAFSNTKFYHHPLLINENGEKLSKSAARGKLNHRLDYGTRPDKFYRWLSSLMNWGEEAESLNEMLRFVNQGLDISIPQPIRVNVL